MIDRAPTAFARIAAAGHAAFILLTVPRAALRRPSSFPYDIPALVGALDSGEKEGVGCPVVLASQRGGILRVRRAAATHLFAHLTSSSTPAVLPLRRPGTISARSTCSLPSTRHEEVMTSPGSLERGPLKSGGCHPAALVQIPPRAGDVLP
ncbi:hypothetical protein DFH09DRAFT_1088952 [Mycena vulgaris]|nr:hypothetical protein DFH09DRAFT_1088952 [Mycena vulgaris]